jgi:subtilase family serine protease
VRAGWRRRGAVLGAAALGIGMIAATATGTTAAAKSPVSGPVAHYAINQPLCKQATAPHMMTCFAMRRVEVAKGTPGAYKYTPPNSLSANAAAKCHGNNPIALGPAGGYTPADLAAAYGYNANKGTRGQLVAIIDWFDDPHTLTDLNTFDKCYGFPKESASSFRKVNQNGKPSPLPKKDAGSGGEITLDIESVRAVCHTCRILLIEANGPFDSDLATAENRAAKMGATEISNSFGEPEHKVPSSVFNAYNHPGIVITASTGDDGWYGWDFANNQSKPDTSQNAAEFPATDPDVVSVGGTAILLHNNGSRGEEYVWNENGVDDQTGLNNGTKMGAGGGGCSTRYAAKPWQADYAGYPGAHCKGKRLAADISAIADPQTGFDIFDSFGQPGWETIGGTSLAAPVTAALFALAGGSGGAAYPSSSLYVNAAKSKSSVFDVVNTNDGLVAGNSFCGGDTTLNCGNFVFNNFGGSTHNPNGLGPGKVDCSFPLGGRDPAGPPPLNSGCNAVAGYDGPTGLGTPNGLRLYTSTAPRVTLTGPQVLKVRSSAKFTVSAHNRVSGAHVKKYAFRFGDGHSVTSSSPKAHHTYKRPGTFTATVTVTDSLHQVVIKKTAVTVHKKH